MSDSQATISQVNQTQNVVPDAQGRAYVMPLGGTATYFRLKRILDFVAASVLLILLAPLIIAIMLMVKLTSKGSAFFTQERIGSRVTYADGRPLWELFPFTMLKFRTMRDGAKSEVHHAFVKAYINNDAETMKRVKEQTAARKQVNTKPENKYKLDADPRITSIGKFLRKTSLDELPQLINVIRGEMSLVGPRPPLPYEVAEYKEPHFDRFAAYQGITGYWQVKGRSAVSFEQMIELDRWYAKHQSVLLDIKILVMTPLRVLIGDGAG